MKGPYAIGSDIGGSHISCALVDMNTHEIIEESLTHLAVDNKASASEITSHWAKAISESLLKLKIKEPLGIGLAMPGPFDYVNGIGLFEGVAKFEKLNGVNISETLKSKLKFSRDVPIRFLNDATSFAVGAVWSHNGLADKNVLALTIGTGFGSSFIMNSLPVFKDKKVPEMGFVYHLPFKNGIADDNFSTRGLIKSFQEKSGITVKGVKDIAEIAPTMDLAAETFAQFGDELATFLIPWIRSAEITTIIIGGNIAKAFSLFKEALEAGLKKADASVDIQISVKTDRMAILGSARLANDNYYSKILPLLK